MKVYCRKIDEVFLYTKQVGLKELMTEKNKDGVKQIDYLEIFQGGHPEWPWQNRLNRCRRLALQISRDLLQTMVEELVENSNVFELPIPGCRIRLGMANISGRFKKQFFRPHLYIEHMPLAWEALWRKMKYNGYRFQVAFGKSNFLSLKALVNTGKQYRNIKEL